MGAGRGARDVVFHAQENGRLDPDSLGTLQRLMAFEYEISQGGFAQLLFNARGAGLAEYEDMLIEVGAARAHDFYVRAIRLALADRDAYRAFLAAWSSPGGRGLRDELQLLSVEYLAGNPTIVDETGRWFEDLARRV